MIAIDHSKPGLIHFEYTAFGIDQLHAFGSRFDDRAKARLCVCLRVDQDPGAGSRTTAFESGFGSHFYSNETIAGRIKNKWLAGRLAEGKPTWLVTPHSGGEKAPTERRSYTLHSNWMGPPTKSSVCGCLSVRYARFPPIADVSVSASAARLR